VTPVLASTIYSFDEAPAEPTEGELWRRDTRTGELRTAISFSIIALAYCLWIRRCLSFVFSDIAACSWSAWNAGRSRRVQAIIKRNKTRRMKLHLQGALIHCPIVVVSSFSDPSTDCGFVYPVYRRLGRAFWFSPFVRKL
jgi:hypothetical protein